MNTSHNLRETHHRKDGGKPALVPFLSFFAVFGYAVFCVLIVLAAVEGGSWLAWTIRQHVRSPARTAAAQFVASHVRGRRGGQISRNSDEVLTERMGGATAYDQWVDEMSASTAYDRSDWAEDFWMLERQRLAHWSYPYEPFRVWGTPPWEGKFVNNVQTEMGVLRRTVSAPNSACASRPPLRVWIFGGSTVWGVGVPDADTMPSQLARQASAAGRTCLEVTNLGVEAYVANQEVIFLIQQLKSGRRPDLVIFYDGLNDACVGGVGRTPEAHNYLVAIKTAFETSGSVIGTLSRKSYFLRLVRALRRRADSSSKEIDLSAQARATLDNYEANIAIVRALGEKYRFQTWFFWQPTLIYGKKPLDRFEQVLADEMASENVGGPIRETFLAVRAVYEEAERRSKASGDFEFLGHLFDEVREPVYIDWMHLGPRGNEIVAAAIAAQLQSNLPNSAKIPAPESTNKPMNHH
jgi:lysophospholipase L1-like esterase